MTDPRIPRPAPLTPAEQQARDDTHDRDIDQWERDQDRNGPFGTRHMGVRELKLFAARQCLRSILEEARSVGDAREAARVALDALEDVA